jgi:hypothetical protein
VLRTADRCSLSRSAISHVACRTFLQCCVARNGCVAHATCSGHGRLCARGNFQWQTAVRASCRLDVNPADLCVAFHVLCCRINVT